MKLIDLPGLRTTDVVAVTLELAELANSPVWVVTIRPDAVTQPRRRWYAESSPALAYAAEEADRLGLLLIDLRELEVA